MPIQVHGKTFQHFRQAAAHVAKWKGWSIKRASAYVAVVERKQNPKPARWRGKKK
jgi:hypothetical protein